MTAIPNTPACRPRLPETQTPTAARDATPPVPSGAVLTVILSAIFMGQFDFFVVNVAAPSLQHDLHAGDSALELIVAGYAFAYAGGLITGGRLGDLFGYRRLFVAGTLGFAVTSLLCALAGNPAELIAARCAQGLAAAVMLPQVLALITASYPPASRAKAIAWYGVAGGAGSIAGQIFGGLLVTSGLGWRLIFLVNVPIGITTAVLARTMLSAPSRGRNPGLDPLGALGIAATLGLVLVPLTLGRSYGWPAWTWASLAGSLLVATATLVWQRALARRGGAPVLQIPLLRVRSLRAGLLASAAFMLFFASFMFTLTLLLQTGLGLGPFAAGLVFVPAGVAYSISALAARRMVARYGLRVVIYGCAITAVALAILISELATDATATPVALVATCAAVMSLGNGVIMPALTGATLADIRPTEAGVASGMLTTAQQFASSAGVALVGTAFFAAEATHSGPTGATIGMTWSGIVDLALIAGVAALVPLVARNRRHTASA